MTVTEPGWYRAAPGGGLERVAGLDEDPPGEEWDLVRVEVAEVMVEEPLW